MKQDAIAMLAHLLRRAGFGATRDELESYATQGNESTVEELLHPENSPPALDDEDLIRRYHIDEEALLLPFYREPAVITDLENAIDYFLGGGLLSRITLESLKRGALGGSVRFDISRGKDFVLHAANTEKMPSAEDVTVWGELQTGSVSPELLIKIRTSFFDILPRSP